MVEVEHEGVGAFDEGVGRGLVLLQELELVDDVGLQLLAVFLADTVSSSCQCHLPSGGSSVP